MGTMIEEYRRRHGISGICPINEGVLFLNKLNDPFSIILTGSYSKAQTLCDICSLDAHSIVLEIYTRNEFPYLVRLYAHLHVSCEDDLCDILGKKLGKFDQYTPFVAKSQRDLECWLWEFFKKSGYHPHCGSKLWLDEMVDTTIHDSESMRLFYDRLYSVCMIGRKYILMN